MIRRPLDQSTIELWFTFLDEVNHPSLLSDYDALLSAEERVRLHRFHFEKDQRVHLITRALVRTVLSRYVEVNPAEWVFRRNAYGRPEIEHESERIRSIRFNVSHTAGLVMLGVVAGREIGVDSESVNNRQVTVDLADQFLTEPEKEALRAMEPDEQLTRLFQYWTLKEAYVKAKGLGLSFPLKKVGFSFESDKLNVSYDIQAKSKRESWEHLLMQVSDHHIASVCVERHDNSSLRIVSRKVIPLLREEPFYPSVVHGSHAGRADLSQAGNRYLDL